MANIIVNNIKTLRDEMGLNQTIIARFLNVDQSLISKVEKGENKLEYPDHKNPNCLKLRNTSVKYHP